MQTSVHASGEIVSAAIEQPGIFMEEYQNVENLITHAGMARGPTYR